MESEWFYDYVNIVGPCMTWEMCFECAVSDIAFWKTGKPSGSILTCLDCKASLYTITVWAMEN